MLDRADKVNVSLVVQAINKQLGLPDASAYAFCQGRCGGRLEPGDCADLCSLTRENMAPASSSQP